MMELTARKVEKEIAIVNSTMSASCSDETWAIQSLRGGRVKRIYDSTKVTKYRIRHEEDCEDSTDASEMRKPRGVV
jgi:hypothetical protein